jgi:hypothetical protein
MPQGYFPQKESTLGLTVCHCGQYQTVHWKILEDFAMMTVNTKMRNLQNLLQCCCMLTTLHDGSDVFAVRYIFSNSVRLLYRSLLASLRDPETPCDTDHSLYGHTDRQTDLTHLVASAVCLSAWQPVSHSLTCLRHKSHFHLNGQLPSPIC